MLNALTSVKGNARDANEGAPAPAALKSGAFAKMLRWQIRNPKQNAERWTITPAMASEMLAWNDRNRPMRKGLLQEYAAAMKEGRFRFTGQPIQFSTQRLLDGQHRLQACVDSGATFDALVVFGVPDQSFAFIDIGGKRSPGDIFAINGVKFAALMAATTRWLLAYDTGQMLWGGKIKADNASLYEAYLKYPDLLASTPIGTFFAQNKLAPPSVMTACHYMASRKCRRAADDFFHRVGEGLGFEGKKDPAYRLHKRLIDNAVSPEKLRPAQVAALTIKAWNAFRLGRDVGNLRYTMGETFPKVR